MKHLNSVFLICVVCIFGVQAQTGSDRGTIMMDAGRDRQHADLRFTASVVNQHNCSDGRLIFRLRYNFHNVKGETILLDKRSSIAPGYKISLNAQLAAAGKHEIVVHYFYGISGELMALDSTPDISQFVSVKSGDSYSAEHDFVILPDKKLRPGSYVLQFSVLTWHYAAASNIEWREKWHDKGYLWTNSLMSQPMPFIIDKDPKFAQCS
jgi:hypothetical protein